MQSQEIIDLLLTTSRHPIILLDKHFKIQKTNNRQHPEFELIDSDSSNKSIFEIANSAWKTQAFEILLTDVLQHSKSVSKVPISLTHNNLKRELLITARYFTDTDENILLVIEDVNSGANTTASEEVSKELLDSIQQSSFCGVAIYEPIISKEGKITDFKILFTSNEVPGNFGMTSKDVLGRKCSEVYDGIFENGIFEKMVECFNLGQPIEYKVEVKHGNGTIWLGAAVEKAGKTVTVTSKNCTEEMQRTERLSVSNNLLNDSNKKLEQVILNEFSTSFSSMETGKNFFDFLLLELSSKTGVDFAFVAEVEHQNTGDVMHTLSLAVNGNIEENFDYSLEDSICNETMKGDECVYLKDVRGIFPANLKVENLEVEGYMGLTLRDSHSNGVGVICVMHRTEISDSEYIMSLLKIAAKRSEMELERQRNDKLLEQKNFELERQNKDLASFTYIASHDLQEPLRKIRMFNSRLLEKDGKLLSESGTNYVNSITSTADRMQKLINALLSYSSMDSDDLSRERTNLNVLLKDVMSMMDDILEEKDVLIEAEDLPTLPLIPLQFQQLLYNLLSNAVKYSKADTKCIIKISAAKELLDNISYWRIDIADNGIGFDPQYKDKIFEVFQRLHGKQEYAGTGVGLAICSKIVKNHHGMISAVGVPGEGSTFSIYIPVK